MFVDYRRRLGRRRGQSAFLTSAFIANPVEIDVPFEDFCRLFDCAPRWQLRGLTAVSADKLEAFYDRYHDLYSILTRIKAGQRIEQRLPPDDVVGDPTIGELPADLTIMAPNTTYPLFIVAPEERKNRVRDQLRRPSFGRLALRDKVRFLSYERVEEIDEFFAGTNGGLNVDVVQAKAEILR